MLDNLLLSYSPCCESVVCSCGRGRTELICARRTSRPGRTQKSGSLRRSTRFCAQGSEATEGIPSGPSNGPRARPRRTPRTDQKGPQKERPGTPQDGPQERPQNQPESAPRAAMGLKRTLERPAERRLGASALSRVGVLLEGAHALGAALLHGVLQSRLPTPRSSPGRRCGWAQRG